MRTPFRFLSPGLVLMPTMLVGILMPPANARAARDVNAPAPYHWTLPRGGHSQGWNFSKGVASFNGDSNGFLFSHFRIQPGMNFAAQARMRVLGFGDEQAKLSGFGIVVRTARTDIHTSVEGGSFFSINQEDNNPELYWNNTTIGDNAFTPGNVWHLYRLTVQGTQYTISIDGIPMVRYNISTGKNPVVVGVFSTFLRVKMRDFSVSQVGTAANQTPSISLERYNLTLSDFPSESLATLYLQHYYRNEEIARERKQAVTDLESEGRIVSYGRDFSVQSLTLIDLFASVAAFKTPLGANTDLRTRFAVQVEQANARFEHVKVSDNLEVGELSRSVIFDTSTPAGPASLVILSFSRGLYTVTVDALFNGRETDDMLPRALVFARIIDGRLQAART